MEGDYLEPGPITDLINTMVPKIFLLLLGFLTAALASSFDNYNYIVEKYLVKKTIDFETFEVSVRQQLSKLYQNKPFFEFLEHFIRKNINSISKDRKPSKNKIEEILAVLNILFSEYESSKSRLRYAKVYYESLEEAVKDVENENMREKVSKIVNSFLEKMREEESLQKSLKRKINHASSKSMKKKYKITVSNKTLDNLDNESSKPKDIFTPIVDDHKSDEMVTLYFGNNDHPDQNIQGSSPAISTIRPKTSATSIDSQHVAPSIALPKDYSCTHPDNSQDTHYQGEQIISSRSSTGNVNHILSRTLFPTESRRKGCIFCSKGRNHDFVDHLFDNTNLSIYHLIINYFNQSPTEKQVDLYFKQIRNFLLHDVNLVMESTTNICEARIRIAKGFGQMIVGYAFASNSMIINGRDYRKYLLDVLPAIHDQIIRDEVYRTINIYLPSGPPTLVDTRNYNNHGVPSIVQNDYASLKTPSFASDYLLVSNQESQDPDQSATIRLANELQYPCHLETNNGDYRWHDNSQSFQKKHNTARPQQPEPLTRVTFADDDQPQFPINPAQSNSNYRWHDKSQVVANMYDPKILQKPEKLTTVSFNTDESQELRNSRVLDHSYRWHYNPQKDGRTLRKRTVAKRQQSKVTYDTFNSQNDYIAADHDEYDFPLINDSSDPHFLGPSISQNQEISDVSPESQEILHLPPSFSLPNNDTFSDDDGEHYFSGFEVDHH